MEEDLRMGHTKRGSFIITVAARHDNEVQLRERIQRKIERSRSDVVGSEPTEDTPTIPTFARRVMTTLNGALVATRRHISTGSDFIDLDSAVEAGVRLPMMEALSEIGQAEGIRSVDMRFDWSSFQPEPPLVSSEVEFEADSLAAVSSVSDRLRREHQPRTETIAGQVAELRRTPDQELHAEVGSVVVRAEVEGRLRNVHVELSGADYEAAILAHHQRVPVLLTGTLSNRKRSWVLEGDVRLETSDNLSISSD
jgi:hypothetical protein